MSIIYVAAAASRAGVLALLVGLAAGPALAGQASISYPTFAANPAGGAVTSPVLAFPDSGTPEIRLTFVLPPDYKNGTAVRVVLYLSNGSKDCKAIIVPGQLGRRRGGIPPVNNLDGVDGGGARVTFPADGAIVTKVFKIQPGNSFPGQRSGDGILFGIKREADRKIDSCSVPVFVQNIDIRYATN